MHIFRFSSKNELKENMCGIGVDPYGVKIMLPKADALLIRLNSTSNIIANILKQEMLSLGGDVAVARGALTGKTQKTDCLIMGQLAQLYSLIRKLKLQPFGLRKFADDLDMNIKNYLRDDFILPLGKRSLNFNGKTLVMGVINLTPDSFSKDGLYSIKTKDYSALALNKAQKMAEDGADVIDLGGESSRPGAKGISVKEELRRILPIVKKLAKNIDLPISIDTTKAEVARAALECGAEIVNDISGLRDKRMVKVVAKHKAAVVIMHMLGRPVNMQKIAEYKSLIEDITAWLKKAVDSAECAGIKPNKIIVDPGLGFGKKPEHNLEIIKRLADFKVLGKPILIGPCRKSFIGNILGATPQDRLIGTLAACLNAAQSGASMVRVHDVKEVSQALKMAAAIRNSTNA